MKKPQTNIKKDQFSAHKACVAYIWCYYYNFKEYCENPYKGEEMKDNMDLIQDDEVGEYILDANLRGNWQISRVKHQVVMTYLLT